MSDNIEYLDQEKLKIGFSTLIIKVSSINEYFGQLSEFAKESNLYGVTNGKIHLMTEMMEPSYNLYNLVDRHLLPLGLEENKDYVFVNEQPLTELEKLQHNLPNQSIPQLKNIDWLDSHISPEGNYVWYKQTEEEEEEVSRMFSSAQPREEK